MVGIPGCHSRIAGTLTVMGLNMLLLGPELSHNYVWSHSPLRQGS